MKKFFFKRYRHLTGLALVTLLAIALTQLGASAYSAFLLVVLWQLSQFAMSKKCLAVYRTGVITPEQAKELEKALKGLEQYGEMFKELAEIAKQEGGWAAIKQLPELLKTEKTRNDELQKELTQLRKRIAAGATGTGVRWVRNVPFVTDECAEQLTARFVISCLNLKNGKSLDELIKSPERREAVLAKARSLLGISAENKTAMSTTDIPLPVNYIAQVIELVWAWGQGRQYATVYPLGPGTTKLPRLKAGEDAFGYLGAGRAAGMSQAIAEKRVQAELVTLDPSKFGGLIRVPTELEEDTFIAFGQFIARYIARQMAMMEDKTLFLADGTVAYGNIVGVAKFCQNNAAYLVQLAAGKTAPSDVTLADFRKMRAKVSAEVIKGGHDAAYYMSSTFEPLLASFNNIQNGIVYKNEGGKATLDGWEIRWIGASQSYVETAAPAAALAFFGALNYWYLGERGSSRVDVSAEFFFNTDELAVRALESIDVDCLADDAMSTLMTAAN